MSEAVEVEQIIETKPRKVTIIISIIKVKESSFQSSSASASTAAQFRIRTRTGVCRSVHNLWGVCVGGLTTIVRGHPKGDWEKKVWLIVSRIWRPSGAIRHVSSAHSDIYFEYFVKPLGLMALFGCITWPSEGSERCFMSSHTFLVWTCWGCPLLILCMCRT